MPVDRGLDARVAVAVLGPLRLRSPAGRVELRSRVSRRLLCALALSESHEATAEALTAAIWNDMPSSRSVLPVAVHRCRHLLMDQGCDHVGIETTATGYRLGLDGTTTDLDLFTEFIGLAPHDPSSLGAALALWRGAVLADEPTVAEHFHLRISILERQRRQVALTVARRAVATGDPDRALAALEPLARADPLDEELGATLIEVLAATGRRHEALAEFRRISSALAQELGMAPSVALRLAYQRCLGIQRRVAEWSDLRPQPRKSAPNSIRPATGPKPSTECPRCY
jgi:DNA-binding SARP family transcriptional activator